MLSKLKLKLRVIFQLGFNVYLPVFIIWGMLSSLSPTFIIAGTLLIAVTQTLILALTNGIHNVSESVYRLDQSMQQGAALVEEDAAAAGSLRRNTTHFVQIIIPRRPAANVFKLNRFE